MPLWSQNTPLLSSSAYSFFSQLLSWPLNDIFSCHTPPQTIPIIYLPSFLGVVKLFYFSHNICQHSHPTTCQDPWFLSCLYNCIYPFILQLGHLGKVLSSALFLLSFLLRLLIHSQLRLLISKRKEPNFSIKHCIPWILQVVLVWTCLPTVIRPHLRPAHLKPNLLSPSTHDLHCCK